MKQSKSVTLSAALILAGSFFWLFMGLLIVIGIRSHTSHAPQIRASSEYRLVQILFGLLTVACAFGIATAIGLFRLKRWARISTLLLAGFMASTGTISIALPPFAFGMGLSVDALLFSLLIILLGTWWLWLFTRPSVKAQFSKAA